MKHGRKIWAVTLGLSFAVLLGSCSGRPHPTVTLPPNLRTKTLLVLPFYAAQTSNTITPCPVCGRNNPAGPISPGAEEILTDMLISGLEERGYKIIPLSEVAGELSRMGEGKKVENLTATARRLSERFKAKLVVVGVVFEYKTRQGASLGVEQPAAVSFCLHLLKGTNGRVLWVDRYYEEQKALSEDISNIGKFFKRGGKWVTARRLAQDGMSQILSSFPAAP